MNYYERPELSFSKLKLFNNLWRNNNLELWDKIEDKKSSSAMERGTIIHRMLDKTDNIDIIHIPVPNLNTGKEPAILAQIIEDLDDEVNIEALVARIYNDNYSKPKQDAYIPFFEKVKDYLTSTLEAKISGKYIIQDEKLYWECINSVQVIEEKIQDILPDVMDDAVILDTLYEKEIYWKYQGVECKSKIDRMYIILKQNKILPIVIDYKIISQGIDSTLKKFAYIPQLTFYSLAAQWYVDNNYPQDSIYPQSYLIFNNPEYNIPTTVEVNYFDKQKAIDGGYISTNQSIQDYYSNNTLSTYFEKDTVINFYKSVGIINETDVYNKNYYVGINKLVREYDYFMRTKNNLEL